MSFESLQLAPWLLTQCRALGFRQPTEVQAGCIPAVFAGSDVYAAAKTGSGKTAAFALPILHQLFLDPFGVFAVVLTPTRELAFQIAEQFRIFGKPMGLRDAVIVGGVDMTHQAVELSRRPHVIVATPGRLAAHVQSGSGSVDLSRIKFLVLDEADRLMTNATLQPDLNVILGALPAQRQNLLFSATLLHEPQGRIAAQLRQPLFRFAVASDEATVSTLKQQYIFMPSHARVPYFYHLLEQLAPEASKIIFTSTCRSCEELSLMLADLEVPNVSLHSQKSQADRLKALEAFKSGTISVLVATDVASRGLDIPTVQYVINFNVPKAVEDYVHRVGRTARAGRGGMAVTFVGERDVELLQAIEAAVGVKMTAYEGIVDDEVLTSMNKINMARRTANLKLLESSFVERQQERKQRSRASRGLPDPAAAKAAVVAGKEKRSRAAKKSRATHRE